MQEVKFFGSRAVKSEKYHLPENLGFLHATHFYHLIDLNWSQLNQPIRTDNFGVNIGVNAIVLHFVVVACITDNREFASNRDTLTKPAIVRKNQEENSNDFCRLCGVNLKIKFGNFQKSTKYIYTENLFQPSGCAKHEGKTFNSTTLPRNNFGLNIVKTSVLSSRVCQSCGRKRSTQLNLSSSFALAQKEIRRNVEVPLCPPNQNTLVRINVIFRWQLRLGQTGVLKSKRVHTRTVLALRNH